MCDERRTGLVQKEQLCVGIVINISNRSDEYQCFACGMVLDEREKRKVYFNFQTASY